MIISIILITSIMHRRIYRHCTGKMYTYTIIIIIYIIIMTITLSRAYASIDCFHVYMCFVL